MVCQNLKMFWFPWNSMFQITVCETTTWYRVFPNLATYKLFVYSKKFRPPRWLSRWKNSGKHLLFWVSYICKPCKFRQPTTFYFLHFWSWTHFWYFKDMFLFFLWPKIVIGLKDKCLGLLSKMESTETIYQQLCDKYMKKIPLCHFCVGVYYLGTDRKVSFCGI